MVHFFIFTEISPPSIFHIPADHEPDKQLTDWLKEQGADADTTDKVEGQLAFEHLFCGFFVVPSRQLMSLVVINTVVF